MSSSPPQQTLLGGTIWIYIAEALMLPTGFLTVAFLTCRLAPDGYGLFVLAANLVLCIEWSINAIFSRMTVKFVATAADWQLQAAAALQAQLLLSVVATIGLELAAPLVAACFKEPALTDYLRLFALEIPLFGFAQAHQHILVGIGRVRVRAVASASRWIVRWLAIVLLVELGLSIWGAILGSMFAILVDAAICRIAIQPAVFRNTGVPLQQWRSYAMPLLVAAIGFQTYDRMGLFFLKSLGGTTAQAGFYAAAQNLCLVAGMVALATPILITALNRAIATADRRQFQALSQQALHLTIWLLPFAGLVAGSAPEIVTCLFGRQFLPAAPLLSVLFVGALAQASINVASAMFVAAGKPSWTMIAIGVMMPLGILGHLVAIPQWGMLGAAIVTTAVTSCGWLVTLLVLYRQWQILLSWQPIALSLVATISTFYLASLWITPGYWLLLKLAILSLGILLMFLACGEHQQLEIEIATDRDRS
jgi:O-antigen/teichoic acid export membrane protein